MVSVRRGGEGGEGRGGGAWGASPFFGATNNKTKLKSEALPNRDKKKGLEKRSEKIGRKVQQVRKVNVVDNANKAHKANKVFEKFGRLKKMKKFLKN